jgi:hypothetical protein
MNNLKAGAEIHAGDGGYSIGTQEAHDAFVKVRNQSLWESTNEELTQIRKSFISLHEIGEKNWTPEQKEQVRQLRRRCVELAEYRYSLCK